MYILQFDGMFHNITQHKDRAGLLGYGWYILHNHCEIARGFGLSGHKRISSSNIAEYLAMIEGLEALTDLQVWDEVVEVRGDAKCVLDQMRGSVKISSIPTQHLYKRAAKLANRFKSVIWTWVPRKDNKVADKLSRRGLHQLHIVPDAYDKAMQKLQSSPALGTKFVSLMDLRIYNP